MDNLEKVVSEIKRVCKLGGTILLITVLHEKETVNDPQCINYDFPERFAYILVIDLCFELEKCVPTNMYLRVEREVPLDHVNSDPRFGILNCKMTENFQTPMF